MAKGINISIGLWVSIIIKVIFNLNHNCSDNPMTYILHDRHKGITHNIIGNHPFFTMGVIKKMDPHKVQRLTTSIM